MFPTINNVKSLKFRPAVVKPDLTKEKIQTSAIYFTVSYVKLLKDVIKQEIGQKRRRKRVVFCKIEHNSLSNRSKKVNHLFRIRKSKLRTTATILRSIAITKSR